MLLKALQLTIRCFHKLLTKSVLYRTIFAIVSCLGSSKHIPKQSRNVVAELSASLRSQGRSGCENAQAPYVQLIGMEACWGWAFSCPGTAAPGT